MIIKQIVRAMIKNPPGSKAELQRMKRRFSSGARLPPPPNSKILQAYREHVRAKKITINKNLERLLRRRDVRTLSGVAIITVLTKPYPCPGKCTYCPTEAIMPKSYLSREPAAARALANRFDPYKQVWTRLAALESNGHPTDKIELIIKGGTWNSYPWRYQKWFVKRCFEACNNFYPRLFPLPIIRGREGGSASKLQEVQKKNENAEHRIIGLTIETRPDWVNAPEVARFRELGVTRVELGVQSTNEKILAHIKRGHGMAEVAEANRLLRNAGFKVDMHMMPQLPGATSQSDINDIREIFANPAYRPDMIKIYPTAVVPNTALYAEWKMGKYKPYPIDQLIEAIIQMKLLVPPYCRITRLIRDIPSDYIHAGNKITNLRETIQKIMRERGLKCQCLRCREIGHKISDFPPTGDHQQGDRFSPYGGSPARRQISDLMKPALFIEKYECAGGIEYFLSFENMSREIVFAFCRLRIPQIVEVEPPSFVPDIHRGLQSASRFDLYKLLPEIRSAAFIRELHTYGQLVPIGKNEKIASQHKGLGTRLMREAEKIAMNYSVKKMAVISGVGVRGYYKKLGYRLRGTYMIKQLTINY